MNPRSRWLYTALALAVLVIGLNWRRTFHQSSPFLSKYGADALWSLLIYFSVAACFTRHKPSTIALSVLAFSWSIEFLQCYHALWIDNLRSTRLGALILGSVFNWQDLLAYSAGTLMGFGTDLQLAKRNGSPAA